MRLVSLDAFAIKLTAKIGNFNIITATVLRVAVWFSVIWTFFAIPFREKLKCSYVHSFAVIRCFSNLSYVIEPIRVRKLFFNQSGINSIQ